MLNLNRETAL